MTSETPRSTGLLATKGIELLTYRTPNGHKVSIPLEELKEAYGLEYTFQVIDISIGVTKDPWFIALNLNGRVPVIVDHDKNDFALSESEAIAKYLVRHYDPEHKFSFADPFDEARCDQWLAFCTSELTPFASAAIQFYRFHKQRYAFPTQLYVGQAERCLGVLDAALANRDYLVGPGKGKYSIADMVNWAIVNMTMFAGIGDLARWTNLDAWWGRIQARSQVARGIEVPVKMGDVLNTGYKDMLEKDPEKKAKDAVLAEELKKAQIEFEYVYKSP